MNCKPIKIETTRFLGEEKSTFEKMYLETARTGISWQRNWIDDDGTFTAEHVSKDEISANSTSFEQILQCWLSGQMTAAQFQEHMKDPAFAEWYERQK